MYNFKLAACDDGDKNIYLNYCIKGICNIFILKCLKKARPLFIYLMSFYFHYPKCFQQHSKRNHNVIQGNNAIITGETITC